MITEVKAAGYTVRGVSVGGIYTSLLVPELGAMFDVGLAPRTFAGAKRLFLSHGHVDHTGALASFLGIRALTGKRKPLKVFLPEEIEEPLTSALATLGTIQRYDLTIDAVGMAPGDTANVTADIIVRALRTYHPVPSLAYLFFRQTDKLRPEFRGVPGAEIAARRRAGEVLTDSVEVPELAYATDTLAHVLDKEPDLLRAKVLILECTFLDERKSIEATHAGCHIHLDEIIERADQFKNDAIVLMHFSQIYRPSDVRDILAARCPPDLLRRIVPFAPESSHWPG